jgi:hypothetical protein
MAVKTIETRAVISGQDKTGGVFGQVARKLERLEQAARSAQQRMGSVGGRFSVGLAAEAERIEKLSRRVAEANRMAVRFAVPERRRSFMETRAIFAEQRQMIEKELAARKRLGRLDIDTAAVAGGGAAGESLARRMLTAAGRQGHEQARMAASGMSAAEIEEATEISARLSRQYPSIGQAETMHMLRNARSIVGTYEEAASIMEPLMKLRVLSQAARPGQDVGEDFDLLVKGLEIKGVTQHPADFQRYMEGIAKGINTFGDTLKPYQYYEMFKYGRQATPTLSEKFILSTAPTLAQELGGSSYGNAVSGFNRAIVAGRMEHPAIKEMVRLGLLQRDDVDWLKNGEAKGIKPGHSIAGWQTAQSDPNQWVRQYLLPAMQKLGIELPNDIAKEIGVVFTNRMAAQMVSLLATQQGRIDKDAALLRGSKGLDAAGDLGAHSLSLALEGLHNQLQALAAAAGKPFLQPAITSLNMLSAAFGKVADVAAHDTPSAVLGTLGAVGGAAGAGYWGTRALLGTLGIGAGASGALPFFSFGGAALAGAWLGSQAGQGLNFIGSLAAGKYYMPRGKSDMEDLRLQLAEIEARMAGIRERSKMPETLPMLLDPLEKNAQQLRNRIHLGEQQEVFDELASRSPGSGLYNFGFGPMGTIPPRGGATLPPIAGGFGLGGGQDITVQSRGPTGQQGAALQKVDVAFDKVPIEVTVRAEAGNELLKLIASASAFRAAAEAHVRGAPGSVGETTTEQ